MLRLGGLELSGGWLSFTSVVLRVALTVGTAVVLIGVTSFRGLCAALQRWHVPEVFTTQLLLLYRYLSVLGEEGSRLVRARALRSFGRRGRSLRVHRQLVAQLLSRSLERARRIHLAMLSRGFSGRLHWSRGWSFGWRDLAFVLTWCGLFLLFRTVDLVQGLGAWLQTVAP
jgi:cobalt/nickel transport system permease protein